MVLELVDLPIVHIITRLVILHYNDLNNINTFQTAGVKASAQYDANSIITNTITLKANVTYLIHARNSYSDYHILDTSSNELLANCVKGGGCCYSSSTSQRIIAMKTLSSQYYYTDGRYVQIIAVRL